jgi:glutathione S-transferase
MAGSPAFEAWVKGNPDNNILGDCPFCHRALLTLEEKNAPYERHYIDFAHKPDWLFKVNEKGSVPVVKDLEPDKWYTDSGDFVNFLEDKYPEPALGKTDSIPDTGSKIFPTFVKFLKAQGSEEEELKATLQQEFKSLGSHLRGGGPFLKGKAISAGDLALGPKLYHVTIATKAFKGVDLLAEHAPVKEYLERLQSRQSWKNTFYGEDLVNAGWKAHLESK